MNKTSLIPDKDFDTISKKVKELRIAFYEKKDLKVDFSSLLFTRIDELLEAYSKALNENLKEEVFTYIKNALLEDCYLLSVALSINTIEETKLIAYKERSKFDIMFMDESTKFSHLYTDIFNSK